MSLSFKAASFHAHVPTFRRILRGTTCLAISAGILAGCAQTTQIVGGITNSFENLIGGYVDQDDVCVAQRRELVDSASLFSRDDMQIIATSIGIGVFAGVASGDWTTGVAAAAVTLAGSYISQLIQEGKSSNEIADTVSSDIRESNSKIDDVKAAFKQLDGCRVAEARTIKADYAAGRIDRSTALALMDAVKTRRAEDLEKFRELADNISLTTDGYAAAYNEFAADNARRGFEIQENKPLTVSRKVADKKATPEGSLADASSAKLSQLQRDCLTNARKRDECFDLAEAAESKTEAFTI